MANYPYINSIARIIHDYATTGKKVDAFYVDKMAELIIKEEGLNDFVLNKNFTDKSTMDNDSSAEYVPEDREIFFSLKALNTAYKRIKLEVHSKRSKKYVQYILADEIILHEFCHAIILKSCLGNSNTLETRILRLSLFDEMFLKNNINFLFKGLVKIYGIHTGKVYDTNYKFAPEERFADIYSHSILQCVTEILRAKELCDYETYSLYKMYFKSYKKQKNPTIYYLKQLYPLKSFCYLDDEARSLPLEERLRLGLSLSEEEYNQVCEEYKRMKKRVFK